MDYFAWLSSKSVSLWNNDSAVCDQVEKAVRSGAVGCTTNPPLSYEALIQDGEYYGEALKALDHSLPDDEFAFEAMGLVVRRLAGRFWEMHREKGTFYGAVRAQVQPNMRDDAAGMLKKGKIISSWGKNVMVKIPATKAGILVLEELAALGVPTNPTVVTTVAQAVAAGEAFERGVKRAKQAGIAPAWSSCAVVMGRAQDYFMELNRERSLGLSEDDLAWAALAIVKRSAGLFEEKGFTSLIMPAAFRCAMQVEQLSGGRFCSTVHPKIQQMVEDADQAGKLRRAPLYKEPVDKDAIARVSKAMPEFLKAFEPDGLLPEEFGTYGASKMTLDGFEATGWQKLISLK